MGKTSLKLHHITIENKCLNHCPTLHKCKRNTFMLFYEMFFSVLYVLENKNWFLETLFKHVPCFYKKVFSSIIMCF